MARKSNHMDNHNTNRRHSLMTASTRMPSMARQQRLHKATQQLMMTVSMSTIFTGKSQFKSKLRQHFTTKVSPILTTCEGRRYRNSKHKSTTIATTSSRITTKTTSNSSGSRITITIRTTAHRIIKAITSSISRLMHMMMSGQSSVEQTPKSRNNHNSNSNIINLLYRTPSHSINKRNRSSSISSSKRRMMTGLSLVAQENLNQNRQHNRVSTNRTCKGCNQLRTLSISQTRSFLKRMLSTGEIWTELEASRQTKATTINSLNSRPLFRILISRISRCLNSSSITSS